MRDLCDLLVYAILRHVCGYISTVTGVKAADRHTRTHARTQDGVKEIVWRVVSEISRQEL
jgi:hypothetical protein